MTLAETGMRVGELVALEWRAVDLDRARFRVRHGKTAAARSHSRKSLTLDTYSHVFVDEGATYQPGAGATAMEYRSEPE